MRIGFDLRPAYRANSWRRGIGRVCHRLARELLQIGSPHDYLILAPKRAAVELPGRYSVEGVPSLRRPKRLEWVTDQLAVPFSLRGKSVDLFHATDPMPIPRLRNTRVVVTIYDLIPLLFEKQYRPAIPWDYRQALRLAYRQARSVDRVVTCSEHSKRDICEFLQVEESKVSVVHLACDESLRPLDPERCRRFLEERRGLSEPFLFYVGGSDYRKNLPFLVRAFGRARRRGYPGKLVLAGETFLWNIDETRVLHSEIARLGLESEVLFPGFVEDSELPRFYGACDLFVFPSLYEGFGIPVLEALQSGAPVLAARTSSIPEVAGEAARYFDPLDETSFELAVEELQDAARRQRLRETGFRQAAKFAWRKSGEALHDLYSALLTSR